MFSPLSSRTVSAFPLSIGTSLSFESIFEGRSKPYDPDRQIPNQIDIRKYSEIWINISTLYRNMVGAIEKGKYLSVSAMNFKDAIIQEMEVIDDILLHEGNGVCKARFYFCSYDKQYKKQNHKAVMTRSDNTDNQKLFTERYMSMIKVLKEYNDRPDIKYFDDTIIPETRTKALILSHYPFDLLSYTHFDKLDLLESHTGKLKPRNLWYTKYYPIGKEELNTLPFTRKLLLIFGDHVMFAPMDFRFRKLILEISRTRQWSPLTTESKIVLDLEVSLQERYLYDMYKAL